MKIVADDKIPYISDFFTQCDEIIYLPGELISHADLRSADILLTRTVTRIDQSLLENTSVKFVGTATTGTDHVDMAWLEKSNIAFADAAGANAQAVADYVALCVAALEEQGQLQQKKVVGVIGYGRIGRLVANFFQLRGFEVICCDPFSAAETRFHFVSLEDLIKNADLISIHTPLTKNGSHPTFHLLTEALLQKIKPGAILLNTARGGVVDEAAILRTKNMTLCFDVWENEPHISLALLNKVFIGTPHIAGYSQQAKYRATEMLLIAAANYFGWPTITAQKNVNIKQNALSHYDPLQHTQSFRAAFQACKTKNDIEKIFIAERKKYPLR